MASAVLYSLVETAKENNLDPHGYLTHVLSRAPSLDLDDPAAVATLLPDMAPDACRIAVSQTSLPDCV